MRSCSSIYEKQRAKQGHLLPRALLMKNAVQVRGTTNQDAVLSVQYLDDGLFSCSKVVSSLITSANNRLGRVLELHKSLVVITKRETPTRVRIKYFLATLSD
jgi:hypothetical protein